MKWTAAVGRTILVNCGGGCSHWATYYFYHRLGCNGEPEFLVNKYDFFGSFCMCPIEDVIAAAFKDLVQNPPPGYSIPLGTNCVNYWRFNTSNCWGEEYPVQGPYVYSACNDACCWARFKICRTAGGTTTIMTRMPGENGNINLPHCNNLIISDWVQVCTPICSQLWDHFPVDQGINPGAGN